MSPLWLLHPHRLCLLPRYHKGEETSKSQSLSPTFFLTPCFLMKPVLSGRLEGGEAQGRPSLNLARPLVPWCQPVPQPSQGLDRADPAGPPRWTPCSVNCAGEQSPHPCLPVSVLLWGCAWGKRAAAHLDISNWCLYSDRLIGPVLFCFKYKSDFKIWRFHVKI